MTTGNLSGTRTLSSSKDASLQRIKEQFDVQ